MSPREQAPGPRGSPQDPQAPRGDEDSDGAEEPLAETAKTESCGASLVVWHFGQLAFSFP